METEGCKLSKLIVDDLRVLNLSGDVVYARTPKRALELLKERSSWEELWLDHDLGYSDDKFQEIWPVINYLEEQAQTKRIEVDQIYIITNNPFGAQMMKLALDKIGYSTTILDPKPYLAGVLPW